MKDIYLLLGFGVTNKNMLKFLRTLRKKIIIYDENTTTKIPSKYVVRSDQIPYERIKQTIISPGIPPNNSIVQELTRRGIKIITDMDFVYLYNQRKKRKVYYIGVTGSNGKTTTVNLIHQLLGINNTLCGNVGLSLFSNIKKKNYSIYLMEVSSFQLHYMKYIKFDIGLVINIHNNHDEWHGGFETYQKAKLSLEHRSKVFINASKEQQSRAWTIDTNRNILFYNNHQQLIINNPVFSLKHNQTNLLNSLNLITHVYKDFGKSISLIDLEKINKFKTPKYRQEIIYHHNNLLIINDSKSTNLDSTRTAVSNFIPANKKVVLLIGGLLKGDYGLLTEITKSVYKTILFGAGSTDTYALSYITNINNNHKNLETYSSLNQAIESLRPLLKESDLVILFSPGGSSYDEFLNYEKRGEFFTKRIRGLL